MPKTPIKYSSTILYKLCCKDLNIKDLYVGHTTNFTKRKHNHKGRCCNENDKSYHFKVYQFIRDNGGWENWELIEIEKCNFNDENEAKARERYWIETLNSSLNSYIPLRTVKEYRETHKEQKKIANAHYKIINSEKIKAMKSRSCTCEVCGVNYTHCHKTRHERSKFHLSKLISTD
jgi:hypothetical protein